MPPSSPPAPIAITGLSAFLPGSDSAPAFWRQLLTGRSALGPVPADRWSPASGDDPLAGRAGGFMADLPFDPLAYGIPPANLPYIEPMQLMALQLIREALDDSLQGAREDPDCARTSVLVGVSGGMGELGTHYVTRTALPGLIGTAPDEVLDRLPDWGQDSFAGILPNVISGRISNRFNFGGTNIAVDAESASALAALSLAQLELLSHRADRVIVAGIDATQTRFGYLCHAAERRLSAGTQPAVFDARADGTVPSEAMGALVLRRLDDAERDGDRIYALLRGIGGVTDLTPGPDQSGDLSALSVQGHRRALETACAQAGITADQIDLFEAAADGCPDRDSAELEALSQTLQDAGAQPGQSLIGSAKPLIGHAKAASGLIGMMKLALGLHHHTLPPHAGLRDPHPVLRADETPLTVAQTPRHWPRTANQPRRAGVSAFGTGGLHYHAVLEEYPGGHSRPAPDRGQAPLPLLFRAADADGLRTMLANTDPMQAPSLEALARQLAAKAARAEGEERLAVMASSRAEAAHRLAAAATDLTAEGAIYRPSPALAQGGTLAFALAGEEAAHPGMMRASALLFAPLITHLAASGVPEQRIWPADAFDTDTRRAQARAVAEPATARASVAALQAGLARALADLGVRPDLCAGRGFGRNVALYLAGSVDLDALMVQARDGAAPGAPSRAARPALDLGSGAVLDGSDSDSDSDDFAEPDAILHRLSASGCRVLVDLGPGSAATDRLRRLAGPDSPAIVALDRDGGDAPALMAGLAELWAEGAPLDLAALLNRFAECPARDTLTDRPTAWLINGAYARPASAPPRDTRPPAEPVFEPRPPEPAPAAADTPKPGIPPILPRYIQRPFAEDARHAERPLPDDLVVALTETADGFDQGLAEALRARGARPVILPTDIGPRGEADALQDWAATLPQGPLALIHLDGMRPMPDLAGLGPADWQAIHAGGTKRFFALLQALAPRLEQGGRVVAATQTGGLFGRVRAEAPGLMSCAPGLTGIVKALTLEWLECSSKCVDLDPDQPAPARAEQILSELSFPEGRREVGYPGGQRTIFRTEPAALAPPETPPITPDRDWVILATGGARGITAECLRTLAPSGARLVLVGRSALPAPEPEATRTLDQAGLRRHYFEAARADGTKPKPVEIEARVARHLAARDMHDNLDAFARAGAQVEYRATDAADPEAMQALLEDLYARHGRIDMVIHGAGLIEDALLTAKSRESFDRVFDTKVDAALALTRHLRPETLKSVVFFTSVAGRYGNRGQTDYAAANETLNRIAWDMQRRWPHVGVHAINWGPWGQTTTGAGMVTEPVRQQFLARGIGMVEAVPGREMFRNEVLWAPTDSVEVTGWIADGERMEAEALALPADPARPRPVGPPALMLRDAVPDGADGLLWRLDPVVAPFLDDHRFDGRPVLPMMAFAQAASEVPGALGHAGEVIAIEDLRVFRGLTLDPEGHTLRFAMDGPDAEGRCRVTLGEPGAKAPRYRCDLRLAPALPPAPIREIPAVTQPWTGKTVPEIYRDWLSHGPSLHTITRIDQIGTGPMICEMRATRPEDLLPVAPGQSWSFDIGLLDGVLQLLWVRAREIINASALPVDIKSIHRFSGNPQAGPVTVEVEILSAHKEDMVNCHIWIWDATGALIYRVENFRGQATAQLNRISGGWPGGRRGA